ncbi:uncharacterized protein K452DRAFT_99817 [Aplosporella prunicola CBS 121167]|uniref:Uncharacterized protein n=1 Tax=Aplosporella prunicola CBS 121167 TaxID=1176127 RepID=A0A6A6B3S7_9PEZI|nr:uncharacterized protein K452DRAFT_99817 [Aplosporella prunicola CBS 121167]KAF2137617.1 hypothetical protein K452DRAFT_99817 [Aplosporella prunicola CBS 121167]
MSNQQLKPETQSSKNTRETCSGSRNRDERFNTLYDRNLSLLNALQREVDAQRATVHRAFHGTQEASAALGQTTIRPRAPYLRPLGSSTDFQLSRPISPLCLHEAEDTPKSVSRPPYLRALNSATELQRLRSASPLYLHLVEDVPKVVFRAPYLRPRKSATDLQHLRPVSPLCLYEVENVQQVVFASDAAVRRLAASDGRELGGDWTDGQGYQNKVDCDGVNKDELDDDEADENEVGEDGDVGEDNEEREDTAGRGSSCTRARCKVSRSRFTAKGYE